MIKVKPDVRIIAQLRDEDKPQQFFNWINVNTNVGFNGNASANVTFSDKDVRFLQKLISIELAKDEYSESELTVLESFLNTYSNDPWIAQLKKNMDIDTVNRTYKAYDNPFRVVGLIWIEARGRRGKWFRLFSGVITGLGDTHSIEQTGTVTLQCEGWYYFCNYYPVVTGLNNLGKFADIETYLTRRQSGATYQENKFAWGDTKSLFGEVIDVINQSATLTTKDDNNSIFNGRNLWEDITDPSSDSFEQALGTHIQADVLTPITHVPDNPLLTSYYPENTLAYAFMQKQFREYEIFKRLIRSKFTLFTVEKEYASALLERMAQSVFADVYVDPLGNLRIEAPNFNACPNVENEENPVKFHGDNYMITRKDASYISSTFEFDSTAILTFLEIPFTWKAPTQDLQGDFEESHQKGYDSATIQELQTYGLREFSATPILSGQLPLNAAKKYGNDIARAIRLKLSQKAGKTTYLLNQRPDLELNRTIFNIDRAQIHLITGISNQITRQQHVTTVTCEYSRFAGQVLPDPWKILREKSGELPPADDSQNTNLFTGV